MGKKLLFSLEMNGKKVHTLEELKENFDIGKVLTYAENGQLARWLRDRGAAEMAAKIDSLDKTSEEFAKGVCEAVLGETSEAFLQQIVKAKAQKEQAERIRMEEEKAAAEQMEAERAEQERKREEARKMKLPAVLVKGDMIYHVADNRLIACMEEPGFYSSAFGLYGSGRFYREGGVVQEAEDIYYLKEKEDNEYVLNRMNLATREDVEMCEMEDSQLFGVRNHKLFYQAHSSKRKMEIMEMDLNTLQKRIHKIDASLGLWHDRGSRKNYLIDETGKHFYCCAAGGVAEIDLEQDTISEILPFVGICSNDACQWHANWGIGRSSFLVHKAAKDEWDDFRNRRVVESQCFYFDMDTKSVCRLEKLEEAIYSFAANLYQYVLDICCGERKVYWLAVTGEYTWEPRDIKELRVMEYDIATGASLQRAYLDCRHWNKELASKLDLFVSSDYLYLYNYESRLSHAYNVHALYQPCESWRFPLDTWNVERLINDGAEYEYV